MVDSAAAAVGGFFGASSITTYIESASGVAEGGPHRPHLDRPSACSSSPPRSFSPVIAMVGGALPITAGALNRRRLPDDGTA